MSNQKTSYAFPCDVIFNIWDDGDSSVGIGGSNSSVTTFICDEEHLEGVREILKEAFSKIHEFKINVMTDQEIEFEDSDDFGEWEEDQNGLYEELCKAKEGGVLIFEDVDVHQDIRQEISVLDWMTKKNVKDDNKK